VPFISPHPHIIQSFLKTKRIENRNIPSTKGRERNSAQSTKEKGNADHHVPEL
jgi:hypothetical protein